MSVRQLFRLTLVVCFLYPSAVFAQANGKLQIHYMDVGQGDGAVLISPQGEVVLFDNGVLNQCGKPLAYLQGLGITDIDYHIASHYHSDHIGCTGTILQNFPLQRFAYDRGASYSTNTYNAYVAAVGTKRVTATAGATITLDPSSAHPVTIRFIAVNGAGVSTTDENDLSLVARVEFGNFQAEFGGDLSGASTYAVDPDPSQPCTYSVSPTSLSAGAAGGTFTVSVTTSPSCAWTGSSAASWLALSNATGRSGSGTASVVVSSNAASSSSRSGNVTIAGQTVSVSQAAGTSTPPPSGNTCPRPASAPASATAICADGTYSSSQNRSGTCSSHGGVQCWLCPGTLCSGLLAGDVASSAPEHVYADIESLVAGSVGQIEVYKVHHHGSKYSSNASWLSVTTPKVSVLSVGNANSYGHPTAEALSRLRSAGSTTYWTSVGNGAPPAAGWDYVAGNTIVEVSPGASRFTVRYGSTQHDYATWGATLPTATAPAGSFDTPAHGSTVSGSIAVTGWAVDDTGISSVNILRDAHPSDPPGAVVNGRVFVGTATFVRGSRPDIAATFPNHPESDRAGWGYLMLTRGLIWDGQGAFNLYAIATDTQGNTSLLGTKQIVVNNAAATKPFGNIDTPGQGGTVSGTLVNFGWVLTPNGGANIPPQNVQVAIDGVLLPLSSQCLTARADITSGFAGFDTSQAIRCFVIDTTQFSNGLHTIGWLVTDSTGQADGIGSRFFTIANPTTSVQSR